MLMPKKNLVCIYEHLFKEGVMVAKKDTHAPKHPEIDVPNLHVMKALNVSYSINSVAKITSIIFTKKIPRKSKIDWHIEFLNNVKFLMFSVIK